MSKAKYSRHGMYGTPTYRSWTGMRQRCNDPNADSYARYGANGVAVCERWDSFENFLEDMGPRPDSMTIDRIESTGDYEPSNCRWATLDEQARNKSNNLVLDAHGVSMCIADWIAIMEIPKGRVRGRIDRGWSLYDSVFKPIVYKRYYHNGRNDNELQ